MFKSIRFRFTFLYFLLVFVAMILVGVFILQSFQSYNFGEASKRLDDVFAVASYEIDKVHLDRFAGYESYLDEILMAHIDIGLKEEIYFIDTEKLSVVSSSSQIDDMENLFDELVIEAMLGNSTQMIKTDDNVSILDKAYPYTRNNAILGVIYLRYDLSGEFSTLAKARSIIFQSILFALFPTVLVSYMLSKSITDPINEVTIKARKLATGDFDQTIVVRSDDEIGAFSQTFNFLVKELKQSINSLKGEKSKLETIINHIDDALIAVNSMRELLHINSSAITLFGTIEPEHIDYLYYLIEKVEDGKVRFRHDNKVLEMTHASFFDEQFFRLGTVFVLKDVTEESRLENMRKEFVANVSHELKTPLTSIKGYSETLLDGAIEDKEIAQKFLTVINSEADRMTRLVRELLELSNYDAKSAKINLSRASMTELIESAITATQQISTQLGISLEHNLEEIELAVDRSKIEQVFINLLSNAIKYSKQQGTVKIIGKKSEKYYKVSFIDDGIGIPAKDLPRIFERFYRVDKARSRAEGGTGLGLSISKQIIELHQGKITVDSVIDEGTTMTVYLPIN